MKNKCLLVEKCSLMESNDILFFVFSAFFLPNKFLRSKTHVIQVIQNTQSILPEIIHIHNVVYLFEHYQIECIFILNLRLTNVIMSLLYASAYAQNIMYIHGYKYKYITRLA